ncbi:MAG: DUF1836 domain-containing protein [Clostridiales bacterium]|nr:DUF1836 domain-containing protein [Clostridiales bacterium]
MTGNIPGTSLVQSFDENNAFGSIGTVLAATGGLTLSQLAELVGTEATTIQNWVKRGWVENPGNRRYGEVQTARVIIINMLKSTLRLEDIARLMRIVNGRVDDRSDDIIPDRELYNYLCFVICRLEETGCFTHEHAEELINESMSGYTPPHERARDILFTALMTMTMAYISSELQKQAEKNFEKIKTLERSTAA